MHRLSLLVEYWGLTESSRVLLLGFVALIVSLGLLYQVGLIQAAVRIFSAFASVVISAGFTLWKWLFSWAPWPVFGAIVIATVIVAPSTGWPLGEITGGAVLLFAGVVTCLAFIHVDLERFEVSRGYKALHNPLKGQSLAASLLQYGDRVGFTLLLAATLGAAGGFALLNHGLYSTIGKDWYQLRVDRAPLGVTDVAALFAGVPAAPAPAALPLAGMANPRVWEAANPPTPDFGDFLAYTLLHLLRVVDMLDIANSYNYTRLPFVHQAKWPAATLLVLFKSFFTMLLLQQVFTAFRHTRLLSRIVEDFWSPHEPIHKRARHAISQYGTQAVRPLLRSVGEASVLSEDQRTQIADALAEAGPVAVPLLVRALRGPEEGVRAVAALALGRLRVLAAVDRLIPLCADPSEAVRQGVVEALGAMCLPGAEKVRKEWHIRRNLERFRSWLARLTSWIRHLLGVREPDPVDRAVGGLRTMLADPSAMIRSKAAWTLGQLGPAAAATAEEMLALLGDGDDSVRVVAAEALGRIGTLTPQVASALVQLLGDASPNVRAVAASALGTGKDVANLAVPDLVRLLQDPEEPVRRAAAEAIAKLGTVTASATPRLVEGLTSEDNMVREQTAEVLGEIGTPAQTAVPALIRALEDSNDRVRASAARSLGKMKAPAADAVPALTRALADPDHLVGSLAAEALGEIGPAAQAACPELLKCLDHVNPQVRAEAVRTLGKISSPDDVAEDVGREVMLALEKASEDDDPRVRGQALTALAGMGQGPSLELFLRGLRDSAPQVRSAAAAALRQRGERSDTVTRALLETLDEGNDQIAVEAARSLGQLADPAGPVTEGLCKLLHDDTPEVQTAAAEALGQFGPQAAGAGPELLRAMGTAKPEVRQRILRTLALVRPPEALTAFTGALQDPDGEIRKLASASLLTAPELDEEALLAALDALRDPEPRVRANVAVLLTRQPSLPDAAFPLLVECTAHADDRVRLNALRALQAHNAQLLEAETARLLADPNVWIRLEMARFLVGRGAADNRGTAAIQEALASPTEAHRRAAVGLISSMNGDGAAFLPALRKWVETEPLPDLRLELDDLIGRLETRKKVV